MRETNIKTSHFSFIAIKKLNISREINQHGKLRLEGLIKESDIEPYRQMLLEGLWLHVTGEDEDGNSTTLFYGIVTDFTVGKIHHSCELKLTVMTGTHLMDLAPRLRTFQDSAMSYIDVMNVINASYHQPGVIGDDKAKEAIGEFFLQNNETDWAFIKRLASKCGSYITPGIEREGVIYYFGNRSELT